MSIFYIITNNEELTTLEELGTLKNEIQKQRLLKNMENKNKIIY